MLHALQLLCDDLQSRVDYFGAGRAIGLVWTALAGGGFACLLGVYPWTLLVGVAGYIVHNNNMIKGVLNYVNSQLSRTKMNETQARQQSFLKKGLDFANSGL